jgi:hypothetical protein
MCESKTKRLEMREAEYLDPPQTQNGLNYLTRQMRAIRLLSAIAGVDHRVAADVLRERGWFKRFRERWDEEHRVMVSWRNEGEESRREANIPENELCMFLDTLYEVKEIKIVRIKV